MPYANNKGIDQPVHLHSLISTFVVCCLDSIISILAIKSKLLGLYLVAEPASLSLNWSQTSEDGFPHDVAQLDLIILDTSQKSVNTPETGSGNLNQAPQQGHL